MEPNMKIKYWGVRGSIPTPLTTEELRSTLSVAIEHIVLDEGLERFKVDSDNLLTEIDAIYR